MTLVLALCAAAGAAYAQEPARLVFPQSGFSIAPLEGETNTQVYQALMMFLPPSGSFSPNVNVQIQTTPFTMDQYIAASRDQFRNLGFTIIRESATQTTVTWEYRGAMNNQDLHWYTTAHLARGRYYLVTATAAESQWKNASAVLRSCVDSFRVEPD